MYQIDFVHPRLLYIALLAIPAVVWYVYRHNRVQADLQISLIPGSKDVRKSIRTILRHVPFVLRILAFLLLVIVLARPQSTNRWEDQTIEGIDIMLALDISGSMLAGDFSPNRIEASKDVAADFVMSRPNDRIGLVLFSGESFTQCPLTTDHNVLINLLNEVKVGVIENQETAIGLGLATSVKRLKDSNAKSRVVILVTDGVNNTGAVDPITAAEIAKTFGIRVYTIGVGTHGTAPFPVTDVFGRTYFQQMEVQIDEPMLKKISSMTNGSYFRATNNQRLKDIYAEIDKLEKSKIDVKQYSRKYEEYRFFALGALVLLLLEVFFRTVIFRSVT